MDKKNRTLYRLRTVDEKLTNHTYAEEQVMWEYVRAGDIDKVKHAFDTDRPRHPLILEHNEKKNEEYMAVSAVTILSRIAIEAGVSSSESFLLSDVCLQGIARCKTIEEIHQETKNAHLAFTGLILEHREKSSPNLYVEDCKKDIMKNITGTICLSDVATDLGIRPAYLSRIFSECEGMTVTDYIHQQKVELACNMLTYSDRSIAEVADYLSFSSQSYFGKVFKKIMGITPLQYRKQNHPPEF